MAIGGGVMTKKQDHYLTTAEIRGITGVGRSTVSRLIREGSLPAKKVPDDSRYGYRWMVRDEDLLEAMQDGRMPEAKPRKLVANTSQRSVKSSALKPVAVRDAQLGSARRWSINVQVLTISVAIVSIVISALAIYMVVGS